jgi:hypothetical protein
MQQVELFSTGYRGHLSGKSEVIRLMLKQRIRHHFHLVKMDPLIQLSEPCRQKGRYEVYVMATLSQVTAQFGTHDAAAAVSRINCDANIHLLFSLTASASLASEDLSDFLAKL